MIGFVRIISALGCANLGLISALFNEYVWQGAGSQKTYHTTQRFQFGGLMYILPQINSRDPLAHAKYKFT